jgi:hypothetical protein
MIHLKPEVRKKRGCPRKIWKDEIYTAMNEIDLRMVEWNNRRKWNVAVEKRRQTLYNFIKMLVMALVIKYTSEQVIGRPFIPLHHILV